MADVRNLPSAVVQTPYAGREGLLARRQRCGMKIWTEIEAVNWRARHMRLQAALDSPSLVDVLQIPLPVKLLGRLSNMPFDRPDPVRREQSDDTCGAIWGCRQ